MITGGSHGLGKQAAESLAREGCKVAICARGQEQLDAAAAEFEDIVERVSAANSTGCRLSKRMLESCFDLDFESFFSLYKEPQTQATGSADFREAMTAYRENRPPTWS